MLAKSLRIVRCHWTRVFTISHNQSRLMSSTNTGQSPIGGAKRIRDSQAYRIPRKKAKKRERDLRAPTTSTEAILAAEIHALYGNDGLYSVNEDEHVFERGDEVNLIIESLSSTGEGLGRTKGKLSPVYVVPFSVPGDVVLARVYQRTEQPVPHVRADFVQTISRSIHHDNTLVQCRYFGKCSGCQFQMLPYAYQLSHKKEVVEKAFQNFSGLPQSMIPEVGDTIGSPKEYEYRTKLTPHFDGPRGARKLGRKGEKAYFECTPPIGFMKKGSRTTMDIEECPIATPVVQTGLTRERVRVGNELERFNRGATLLLRESVRCAQNEALAEHEEGTHDNLRPHEHFPRTKICVTDPKSTVTEFVGDFIFTYPSSSFFQNNNSILPTFTSYVRDHILPHKPQHRNQIRNLVDAYCGAGLFSITLSSVFERTLGIDIDSASIGYARANKAANDGIIGREARNAPPGVSLVKDGKHGSHSFSKMHDGVDFIAADATALFSSVSHFDPRETVVILDPPRKGCDESFLRQLLDFGPERILYVSCNVHTQARDVGWLLSNNSRVGSKDRVAYDLAKNESEYEIESLQGFDFFPQTSHVEGVAVLRRRRACSNES